MSFDKNFEGQCDWFLREEEEAKEGLASGEEGSKEKERQESLEDCLSSAEA